MSTTTEARERPILFSGPMVRAILEGRKTQTRRVVKPKPKGIEPTLEPSGKWVWWRVENDRNAWDERRCPYGEPGDLLYVRETWAGLIPGGNFDEITGPPRNMPRYVDVRYRATDRLADLDTETRGYRWRPGIHMPKRFARIWLRVTDVRVERVQEITPEDAFAEGLGETRSKRGRKWEVMSCNAFHDLWDSINADRGHPWESNPWVWVVSFERTESP